MDRPFEVLHDILEGGRADIYETERRAAGGEKGDQCTLYDYFLAYNDLAYTIPNVLQIRGCGVYIFCHVK